MPCPPAEWLRDGVCVPAGVPSDGCGEGFSHDGDRGCEAILPAAPCAAGLMAIPGETSCREVAPCSGAPWGDIPVEPDTEYVDASYPGMDSDGSALKPWTNIQAAIDAASSGAIVAIAEGSYVENLTVSGRSVRLWGVCPALVEVVGTSPGEQALQVLGGADGTEVRSLSMRGDTWGFFAADVSDVLLESVWVHHNAGRGIDVESFVAPTGVTLRASLVEQNHEVGFFSGGSEVTVETSILRDTQPNAQGLAGRGLSVQDNPGSGAPSTFVLRASLLDKNREVALFVESSDATVESSVLRATELDTQQSVGRGIYIQAHPPMGAPSTLLLQSSLIELNHDAGIAAAGSNATVERSVVRNTQLDARGLVGRGVAVEADPATGAPSMLLVRESLVEQNHEIGIYVEGSEATVEASVVRATEPNAQGLLGLGVGVQNNLETGAPSTLSVRSSLVEETHDHGIIVVGSVATLEASLVRNSGKVGVVAKAEPEKGLLSTLSVRASLVEQAHALGIFVEGSEATMETSVVRGTQPDADGFFGRGVNVQSEPTTGMPATFHMHASLVEQSLEAAVAILDSTATLDACLLRDTAASPGFGAGHALIVFAKDDAARATIGATRIHQSALAALAAWGAELAVGNSALTCQAFDLDQESYQGKPASLEDLGGNGCGCPDVIGGCKAVSAGLEPPLPLEPTE
jgi:hypothetical protein